MEKIYNLSQIYNKIKKKQYEEYIKSQKKYYEEYIKRKKKYYIYIKKYYKEYVGNQNKYHLNKKKCYENYIRSKKKYYEYKKKYEEEQYKKSNDILENKKKFEKNQILQSEFFDSLKTDILKENNINDGIIRSNNSLNVEEFLEGNYEQSLKDNIEDKKDEWTEDDEFKNNNSTKELYNEEFLEEGYEQGLKDNIEDKKEEWIEDNEFKNNNSTKELYNEEFLEEGYEQGLKDNIEDKKEEWTEDDELENKNSNSSNNNNNNNNIEEKIKVSTDGLYGKFPVILAEVDLTIPVEGTISLDEEVMEIKRTRKNVFLTQSHIIPFSSRDMDLSSGILFIEGFIKNNIEYEAQSKRTMKKNKLSRNMKYYKFEVPFNFTTKITFLRLPVFIGKITAIELEVFTEKSQDGNSYKESVIGCETYEESSVFTEVFNEKPFVELVKATFIEIDNNKNIIYEKNSTQKITEITEKIILNLTLRVLQKQELKVIIE